MSIMRRLSKESFNLVRDWRVKFDLKVSNQMGYLKPDVKSKELAIKLINEEYQELQKGIESNNRIEILDAIGDLFFVAIQYCDTFNLDSIEIYSHSYLMNDKSKNISFEDKVKRLNDEMNRFEIYDAISNIFNEIEKLVIKYEVDFTKLIELIYASNMSKICKSTEEVNESVKKYKKDKVETYSVQTSDNTWVIKRKSDNKVLKSINFKEPCLDNL